MKAEVSFIDIASLVDILACESAVLRQVGDDNDTTASGTCAPAIVVSPTRGVTHVEDYTLPIENCMFCFGVDGAIDGDFRGADIGHSVSGHSNGKALLGCGTVSSRVADTIDVTAVSIDRYLSRSLARFPLPQPCVVGAVGQLRDESNLSAIRRDCP